VLSRSGITEAILTALQATLKPIGDAIQPESSGWLGEPALSGSNFVPYVVLTPMTANAGTGPFDDSQADWRLPYSVANFGVTRQQCEWMADKARELIQGLSQTHVGSGQHTYYVQQVLEQAIGGIQRVDQTNPPYYGQVDTISIWLAKEF